jgi:general secretion pathway protein L
MTRQRILILFRAQEGSSADWVITSSHNNIQTILHGNLHDLHDTKDANVTVIVPAQDVLLTEATLPKLSRHKLRQALPFALEEQLIDDVAQQHFAIGEYQEDGTLPVAVVAKNKMDHWLATLKSHGIQANAIIPMTLALPFSENHWQVFSYDNINIVRTGSYSGFAADNNTLDNLLDLKFKESPQKEAIKITRSHLPEKSVLEEMATNITSLPFINLLQHPYVAKRKKTSPTKNTWKLAAYFAAAWIGLAFFSNLISFFILHHQASNINDEINQIYRHQFPHATSIVAPRERMETKLKELTNATQKNNFLGLLATVGKSLSQTTGIRLQNLDYRNGMLTLEVSSAAFDNLETLTRNLDANGLNVKQQNSAINGTQVKATLLISAGAA